MNIYILQQLGLYSLTSFDFPYFAFLPVLPSSCRPCPCSRGTCGACSPAETSPCRGARGGADGSDPASSGCGDEPYPANIIVNIYYTSQLFGFITNIS